MQRKSLFSASLSFSILIAILIGVLGFVSAAPAAFDLLTPAQNALVKSVANVDTITWSPSADADSYDLTVTRISDNVRIAEIINEDGLTPDANADALLCDTTTCTYTLTPTQQALFSDGTYTWAVQAVNISGRTEATNSPFFFTVNTQPIELLVNGGFESIDTGTGGALLAPWTGIDLTRSKIRCNRNLDDDDPSNDRIFANTGNCGFLLRVNGGRIAQNANAALVAEGDTLSLSAAINTPVVPAGTIIVLKVVYAEPDAGINNNGRDKIRLSLDAQTDGYDEFTATGLTMTGTPNVIRVIVRYNGTVGRVLIDDISLIVTGPPAD